MMMTTTNNSLEWKWIPNKLVCIIFKKFEKSWNEIIKLNAHNYSNKWKCDETAGWHYLIFDIY